MKMFWTFAGTCLVVLTAYVTMAILHLPLSHEVAVLECKTKFNVPPGDVELLKQRKLPESRDGKCMMACILKKMKVMTKRGQFDLKNVQKWVRNKYHGDQVNLVKGNAVAETCAKMLPSLGVKDECEMAGEIMSCVRRESKLVKNTNG